MLAGTYKRRTLIVDLDSSGNLSASFAARPEKDSFNCVSALLMNGDANPDDFILQTRIPGLDIIPSNNTLGAAEIQIKMDQRKPQQFRLKNQLIKLKGRYDHIILDCPPSESLMVINALACSDEVIVPVTPNKDALEGVGSVMGLIDDIIDYNPRLTLRGVLFERISRNGMAQKMLSSEFSFPRFSTSIRDSVAAEYSLMQGLSFREADKRSTPAIDFDNFVAEYLGLPIPHPDEA